MTAPPPPKKKTQKNQQQKKSQPKPPNSVQYCLPVTLKYWGAYLSWILTNALTII